MAMSAEYRSKFEALYRYNGMKILECDENTQNKQTNKENNALVSVVFYTHPFHIDKVQS